MGVTHKRILCKQCGRLTKNEGHGLCKKHYNQLKKYGKCLDSNSRNKYDPNEYEIKGNVVEVQTYDRLGNPTYKFSISLEDVNLIIQYRWAAKEKSNGVYIVNDKLGYIHNIIMPHKKGYTVDHIDRNPLNNTRENLRYATASEQTYNQKKKENTYCGIKGIYPRINKQGKTVYYAYMKVEKKRYISYGFSSYEKAVYARYLLEQLSPYLMVNGNMSQYIQTLSEKDKAEVLCWFKNRFNNRV